MKFKLCLHLLIAMPTFAFTPNTAHKPFLNTISAPTKCLSLCSSVARFIARIHHCHSLNTSEPLKQKSFSSSTNNLITFSHITQATISLFANQHRSLNLSGIADLLLFANAAADLLKSTPNITSTKKVHIISWYLLSATEFFASLLPLFCPTNSLKANIGNFLQISSCLALQRLNDQPLSLQEKIYFGISIWLRLLAIPEDYIKTYFNITKPTQKPDQPHITRPVTLEPAQPHVTKPTIHSTTNGCGICLDDKQQTLYKYCNCQNGWLCTNCYHKLSKCPFCQNQFDNGVQPITDQRDDLSTDNAILSVYNDIPDYLIPQNTRVRMIFWKLVARRHRLQNPETVSKRLEKIWDFKQSELQTK